MGDSYSAANVSVTWGGLPITGFGQDDVFAFDPVDEGVATVVGTDGLGVYNISADKSATLALTLMANSPAVPALYAAIELQQTTGVSPAFNLTDPSIPWTLNAESAMLQNAPRTFGKEQGSIEFTFVFIKARVSGGPATAPT